MIGFMWRSTPLVLFGLQLLIFQMFFDRIKHNTDLLHKIRFNCIYGEMFLLIESFLSSRRVELWVVKCQPYCECVINSGMHQIFTLIHLFFSTSIVSLIMFCVRLLFELTILLSIHRVINHLTYRTKPSYNLILKIKIIWK